VNRDSVLVMHKHMLSSIVQMSAVETREIGTHPRRQKQVRPNTCPPSRAEHAENRAANYVGCLQGKNTCHRHQLYRSIHIMVLSCPFKVMICLPDTVQNYKVGSKVQSYQGKPNHNRNSTKNTFILIQRIFRTQD
jgi:hypothetical protein